MRTMDILALARELIRIPSPSGNEGPVVDYLARLLGEAGWQVIRQPVSPGRDNLYATLGPPQVVLSTHLDVVPPALGFSEDEEWLHGRGSCDAKGIAAAMVSAAEHLRESGERRVGLLLLVGEEDGSDGAAAAVALEPKGRWLINGEPTGNRLVIGHQGALRVELRAEGVAAHSGYPEEGRSAIDLLLLALERIRALPLGEDALLGTGSLNIGTVMGGVATNVLAPSARAELLIRTVGAAEPLQAAIAAAMPAHVSVTFPLVISPFRSQPVAGWETSTVSYTTDLPLLSAWGEGFLLGPGSIRMAHTDHERVRKSDLVTGRDRYVRLISQLLRNSTP